MRHAGRVIVGACAAVGLAWLAGVGALLGWLWWEHWKDV